MYTGTHKCTYTYMNTYMHMHVTPHLITRALKDSREEEFVKR